MYLVSRCTQQQWLLTHALTVGALELYHPKLFHSHVVSGLLPLSPNMSSGHCARSTPSIQVAHVSTRPSLDSPFEVSQQSSVSSHPRLSYLHTVAVLKRHREVTEVA